MFTPEDHTFVLCAYQDSPYLEDAMISLLDQKMPSNVLLSTHTPSAYIDGLCEKYGIPQTVNPAPRNLPDDWNWGYNAADTALVTIAHQDDYYERDYLERMLEAVNRYNDREVLISFSDYYEIRNGRIERKSALLNIKRIMNAPFRASVLNGSQFVKRRVLAFGDPICCPSVMLNKTVIGPDAFDTKYKNSCDYRTWVNLASGPGRFVYVPEQLMGHRIHKESATSKYVSENIRAAENQAVMCSLWPKPIARALNAVYTLSEKSNDL